MRSTWTRINGRTFHARVWDEQSPDERPAVVCVHGLGVSGTYMVPVATRLAEDHAVYVPDLPGFGQSDRPPHTLDVPGLADALAAWVKAAGPRRAAYLGNSLGCQTVLDFALRYTEHISHAILVGPTLDPRGQTLMQQVLRGLLDLVCERASLLPILVRDYWSAGPIRCLRTLQYALRDPLESKLPRVPVPTLIVKGELDPIATLEWVRELRDRIPHAELVVLPHAPHASNYSAPDPLARAVRRFLSGVPATWPDSRTTPQAAASMRRST